MTEPTQAQIDAAYDAAITFQKARKDTFVTKAMIAAALTAAAQVGKSTDIFTQVNANIRAAELATIERCAQVAENYRVTNANTKLGIAAAIRALATEDKR